MSEDTLMLRSHFATPQQQHLASVFGMWTFLVTEIMLFGGLFVAFGVYHSLYSQAFDTASHHMEATLGTVNTAILICSSFAMTLAVRGAELGKQRSLVVYLILTMLIGAVFLGLKSLEYYRHYQSHEVPGFWFEATGPNAGQEQLFFIFYFALTGLHVLHMVIGEGILLVLLMRTLLGGINAEYYTPVEAGSLYWHFVDVIWLFLFAILYIPGLHL